MLAVYSVHVLRRNQDMSHSQAASYLHRSEGQQELGMRLIESVTVKKGSTVLDLGCGTGYFTKVLSELVGPEGKVVGVDPDKDRLKIATQYSASNIEYVLADDQTFPVGPYDLVFCNCVVHWIKNKEPLFKHVSENLTSGGCFAFAGADGFLPIPAIGKRIFNELVGPEFLNWMLHEKMTFLTAKDYRKLASASGLREVSMTTWTVTPEWRNLDNYVDSMYGWFQGEFDPSEFDTRTFEQIKEAYGDRSVRSEPIRNLVAVLTKI